MASLDLSSFSYHKFVEFAFQEAKLRADLIPFPSHEKFKSLRSKDNNIMLHTLSFHAPPKIRLIRSLTVEGNSGMKKPGLYEGSHLNPNRYILGAATAAYVFPCRDLNPLYDVTIDTAYKHKYYRELLPLGQKYFELLPWGGNITSESLRFFSPIVIWSRFSSSQFKYDVLYSAFMEYFKAWLVLMEQAVKETSAFQICRNCDAQHKYLTWRAEKDPGHPILKKLVGENLAKELLRDFLFHGVDSLGTKTFLDYFPEYNCADGTVNRKRSVMGKSYETRPWDTNGEFIGNGPG